MLTLKSKKNIKKNHELKKSQILLFGSLLIFIGFCIALLIDMLTKKEFKKLFKYILFFFIGFMIPTILLLIYSSV